MDFETETYALRHFDENLIKINLACSGIGCNSMPFGAAWAYYGKVLVLISAA